MSTLCITSDMSEFSFITSSFQFNIVLGMLKLNIWSTSSLGEDIWFCCLINISTIVANSFWLNIPCFLRAAIAFFFFSNADSRSITLVPKYKGLIYVQKLFEFNGKDDGIQNIRIISGVSNRDTVRRSQKLKEN